MNGLKSFLIKMIPVVIIFSLVWIFGGPIMGTRYQTPFMVLCIGASTALGRRLESKYKEIYEKQC